VKGFPSIVTEKIFVFKQRLAQSQNSNYLRYVL